jgi:hypothetical protein
MAGHSVATGFTLGVLVTVALATMFPKFTAAAVISLSSWWIKLRSFLGSLLGSLWTRAAGKKSSVS